MAEYRTIAQVAQDEFVEKRSRFIGYARPVQTEEEAQAFIAEMKSRHWDATHNVYAYILREGIGVTCPLVASASFRAKLPISSGAMWKERVTSPAKSVSSMMPPHSGMRELTRPYRL